LILRIRAAPIITVHHVPSNIQSVDQFHRGVPEFVYIFAENAEIPPKIKMYKIYLKPRIRYNTTVLISWKTACATVVAHL